MQQGFFSKGDIVMGGHFPVSVISKNREDIEKLMAPFQDNNMGTCPRQYLTFVNAEQEYEKEEHSRAYASLYEFANDNGYAFNESKGVHGRWENPNAKWDWYQVGGQFDGYIPLKSGGRASCCRIREADLRKSNAAYNMALRYWDENVTPEGYFDASVREQYLKCYCDRDNFADKRSHFFTGAFVTPDGIWCQIGNKGKLQKETSSSDVDNYYDLFLKTLQEASPDYWLTIVDCHI